MAIQFSSLPVFGLFLGWLFSLFAVLLWQRAFSGKYQLWVFVFLFFTVFFFKKKLFFWVGCCFFF